MDQKKKSGTVIFCLLNKFKYIFYTLKTEGCMNNRKRILKQIFIVSNIITQEKYLLYMPLLKGMMIKRYGDLSLLTEKVRSQVLSLIPEIA